MPDNSSRQISELKASVEVLSSLLGLLYKLAVLGGACIVLSYCIRIGFHPKGMSVGDALLFLFALFAFAAVDVIGLAYGAVSIFWLAALLFELQRVIRPYAKHKFPLEDNAQKSLSAKKKEWLAASKQADW